MTRLDLFDLLILVEICRTRSITAAVDRIGLSQPSISIRLGHLRRHFGDPLFVRTAAGMMPTPRMENLLPRITEAAGLLDRENAGQTDFSPARSDRSFRISCSDVAQIVLLPQLLTLFEKVAPHVKIEAAYLDDRTGYRLEAGEVDVAIGFAAEQHAGVYQQRLFTEHYACIAREAHPRIRTRLTTEQYLAEGHVVVSAPGTGYSLLDKELEAGGIHRSIKVRVPSFIGLPEIITSTDLLASVPARLAQTLSASRQIKAFKIPGHVPSYEVRQYWHQRYHRDPGNRWIRQVIFATFANIPEAADAQCE